MSQSYYGGDSYQTAGQTDASRMPQPSYNNSQTLQQTDPSKMPQSSYNHPQQNPTAASNGTMPVHHDSGAQAQGQYMHAQSQIESSASASRQSSNVPSHHNRSGYPESSLQQSGTYPSQNAPGLQGHTAGNDYITTHRKDSKHRRYPEQTNSTGQSAIVPPGMGQSGIGMGQPNMGQLGTGQPGMGQPGMMQPSMGQPSMGQPGMGQPGMGQPGMGQPGMGQPGMGQPGTGQPGMGQPSMGQPAMGQPGMGQPGMGQPGMGQPGMGQPGMGQPGMGHAGVAGQPGQGGPQYNRPGYSQPVAHTTQPGMQQYGQPGQGAQVGYGQPYGSQGQQRPKKPASKIDPNQIPSPVIVMTNDQKSYEGDAARYVVQPLAEVAPGEVPTPVVDMGTDGPIRCRRCHAYINPFVQFVDGGRRYNCNLCSFTNDVPQNYFCNLDHTGRRMDIHNRMELLHGTVDFTCTSQYYNRKPVAAQYIFAIDVSYAAVQSGMVSAATWTIKNMLDHFPKPVGAEKSPIKCGIVTYDKSVHFYDLRAGLSQPQMLVVADTEVFVPLSDGLAVDVHESRDVIVQLLDNLPRMYANNRETEARLFSTLSAVKDGLIPTGGRIFAFQMNKPSGQGSSVLADRYDSKAIGTDKEPTLLNSGNEEYTELAKSLVKVGVSVEMFLFPNAFADVATLGEISHLTGGHTYVYAKYNAATDGHKFSAELGRAISRPFGYEALMRVRTSEGLRAMQYYGNFFMQNHVDMQMSGIDSDKSVCVRIHYDGTIPVASTNAYLQVAMLYTTMFGERQVRCINFQMKVVNQLSEVFRHAELDTLLNFFAKKSAMDMRKTVTKTIRDNIIEKASEILSVYRKHCASTSSPGQLILPEALKLMPVYLAALLKTDLFRTGADMSVDRRAETILEILSMPVAMSIPFIYPRLVCVSDISETENLDVPLTNMRVSYDRLESERQYLIDNGLVLYLWIGTNAPSQWCQAVFGVADASHIDTHVSTLPELDTPESRSLRRLVDHVRTSRQRFLKLLVVRQRDPSEIGWNLLMVEDAGLDTMSYVDFLCYMHRQIQNQL
eukprot:CFRG5944T1